ncbi:MAG: CPBP family glutamic-type intramembrane protease [Nitrososphaerales archaeon]
MYIVFISDLAKNAINTFGEFTVNFLRGLFITLWLFYLILFIKAIQGPRLPLNKVPRLTLNHGLKYIFDNTLSTLAVTFSALFSITFFIMFLQESIGIPTGSLPRLDPILMFVATSIAPIEEEIIFRVTIIGSISIILLLIRRMHFNPLKVLWHPSRYILELGKKADIKIIYSSIFISGILFGYAHIAFGAGWEIGKVTQAFLAGTILGLIYFFYGFHGAVLLHWSFNYFMDSFYYYESFTYSILFIYLIIFGMASILFLLIYSLRLVEREI